MSKPYDTEHDPVVRTAEVHIAGCLMQIQTTQRGAVLLNGDLIQAFQPAPAPIAEPATAPTQKPTTPPQASDDDDTGFPDIPF